MNVANPEAFRVLDSKSPIRGMNCTEFFYSTDDLVKRLGDEFAEHRVLYDPQKPQKEKEIFIIVTSDAGTATDGVWIFKGPRRSHRVQ